MSVAHSAVETRHVTSLVGAESAGRALPPPAPFDPSTWKNFYYVCVVATIIVGLGTILNGGMWTDAIMRMFITLLGGAVLSIAFLTFVVVPLHVRRYEQLVAAQKATKSKNATNGQDEVEAKTFATHEAEEYTPVTAVSPGAVSPGEDNPGEDRTETQSERVQHDDQASSLRRMAANSL